MAAEPLAPAPELLHQALDLAEAVSRLELEPQRATFLSKQVLAMQTVCQKLCGETFTLEEELQRCYARKYLREYCGQRCSLTSPDIWKGGS